MEEKCNVCRSATCLETLCALSQISPKSCISSIYIYIVYIENSGGPAGSLLVQHSRHQHGQQSDDLCVSVLINAFNLNDMASFRRSGGHVKKLECDVFSYVIV